MTKKTEPKEATEDKKTTKKLKKTRKPKQIEAVVLTPSLLNNQIVKMHDSVSIARRHAHRQLTNLIAKTKKVLDKKKDPSLLQKMERQNEELRLIKEVKRDEISKFALINKNSFEVAVSKAKSSYDRALYRVATQNVLLKIVEEFRKKFPGSEASTAFMLQRLGLQYQGAKNEKLANEARQKLLNNDETNSEMDTNETKLVVKKEKGDKTKKDKEVPKKDKNPVVLPPPPPIAPLAILPPSKGRGQAVVKRLKLFGSIEDDSNQGDSDNDSDQGDSGQSDSDEDSGVMKMMLGEEEEDNEDEDDGSTPFFLSKPPCPSANKEVKHNEAPAVAKRETRRPLPEQPPAKPAKTPKVKGGKQAEEELHPSWIAKQRMKELQKAKPSGKKIVFD